MQQQEPPSEVEATDQIPPGDGERGEVVTEDVAGSGGTDGDPAAADGGEVVPEREPTPEEELARWKGLAMRATADLDNFRKRMAREKSEALRYANQGLLEELFPVLDNFEMGLQAAAADQESMIFRGMAMVKKQLDDFLAGQGVEEIPAEGQVFDPKVHEAVSQEECAETAEGMVLRVMRRGYRMRDRLLRPANVVVAKAPAGESAGEEEGDAQ